MKSYLNGKEVKNWHDLGEPEMLFNNSAFLWGESIFTTGRLENGKLHLWQGHLERLKHAYKWLTQENLNKEELDKEVMAIARTQNSEKLLKFRLTFFYGADGQLQRLLAFSPFNQKEELNLASTQIPGAIYRNKKVKVGQYADVNVLKRALGSELCLISKSGEVLESSTANLIFLNGNDEWLTPYSKEFILEGVGLNYGLKQLSITKKTILKDDLKNMKAAFAINAVQGPVPITKIDDITFTDSKSFLSELKNIWSE